MNKQFASYEISKELKELGFNEECFNIYYKTSKNLAKINSKLHKNIYSKTKSCSGITAPLWQQVIDYLREKYGFHIYVSIIDRGWSNIINKHIEENPELKHTINDFKYSFNIIDNNDNSYFGHYPNYEKSLEKAILKAIELIKMNNYK